MDTVKVTANNADQWDYTCDPGLLFLDPFPRSLSRNGLPSMVILYKLNSIDKWPASDKHAIRIHRKFCGLQRVKEAFYLAICALKGRGFLW